MSKRLSRRHLLGGGLAATACTRRASRPPNILYIMTDDHTAGEMGCYGNRILKTPNLDRLAREGVRFENAFCTNSLCAPSRATALSGCYSHVHGVRGNSEGLGLEEHINPKLTLWPAVVKNAGYRTAVIGKWHLQDPPAGFDYSCVLPGQGVYYDPEFIENGTRRKFKGYATDITTDLALDFLGKVGQQPFALIYQHKAPHRPFQPASRHARLFDDIELPYPPTFDDDYSTRKLAKEAEDMRFDISLAGDYKDLPENLSAKERKKWIYQRFVKDRYRAIVGLDENLGRVLDFLDKNNLAANTLIIYTSDNGFFVGDHGWYDKRFMYEPSLRVPLLVRFPQSGAVGRVENRMALNIDFAPTMLDFAGLPAPESMQGVSLRPLIEGREAKDWRTSVYYSYFENSWSLRNRSKEQMTDPAFAYFTPHRVSPHRGVRTSRHKLIEYYSEGDYWEFFDLQTDPNELNNRYGDAAFAETIAGLKKELARLRDQYGDKG